MVDSFAEHRQRDVLAMAQEIEQENKNDTKYLDAMFNRLDADGTGDLTLEDLVKGAQTDHEFQSRLRVMDIDEADLEQLFDMTLGDMLYLKVVCCAPGSMLTVLDPSRSKSRLPQASPVHSHCLRFVRPLSRWIHESKTAPRFSKYNLERSLLQQEEILKQSHQQFAILQSRLDDLCETILGQASEKHCAPSLASSPGCYPGVTTSTFYDSALADCCGDQKRGGEHDGLVEPGIEQPKRTVSGLEQRLDLWKLPLPPNRRSRKGLKGPEGPFK